MSSDKGPGNLSVGDRLFAPDAFRGIYSEGTSTRTSFEAVLSVPFALTASVAHWETSMLHAESAWG